MIPARAKIASPYCGNCGHEAVHWIAAGQDICEHPDGCNCEHYVATFDQPAEVVGKYRARLFVPFLPTARIRRDLKRSP